jgi:Domain of unknown function (DUF4352)
VTYPQNPQGQPWDPTQQQVPPVPSAPPTQPYGQPYGQPAQPGVYGQPASAPPSSVPPASAPPASAPPYGQPAYGQPAYPQPPAPGQFAPPPPAYGQPAYGQPAYGQPGVPGQFAPPPAKKSRVGLIIGIIAGVVVLLCGGGILVAILVGGTTTTAGGGTGTGGKTAGLNQPVQVGQFQFVVKSVTCGKASEGDDILSKDAQGQYCEVAVTVKNTGKDPELFDGSDQKAKGTNGNTYSDDVEAEIYANSDDATFLNEINPGNTITGVLVFDIPKDAKIVSMELHDSSFGSSGATVSVG